MTSITFRKIPMNEVQANSEAPGGSWLWDGYLAPGNVTLLTSQWKTGKTTLLTGLLRCLERGESFLGRTLSAGKALVVSEESTDQWAERLRRMPVGPHAQLLARPFVRRPTFDEWNALIDDACLLRLDGQLDLFVIDPMAKFLPGAWESNAAILVDVLEPLHRLTSEGASVLLLHHPRKKPSEPGHSARGTGALLGIVDIALELNRYGRLQSDRRRRQIVSLSRNPRTPERLVYEWDPTTGQFTDIGDPGRIQFEQNWVHVQQILKPRKSAATHRELLMDWPADQDKPVASVLYEWLNRAFEEKRVRREGRGTRTDPWRYRLKNEDDEYYDRGEMPPLRDLLRRK
jgi:AAA domain